MRHTSSPLIALAAVMGLGGSGCDQPSRYDMDEAIKFRERLQDKKIEDEFRKMQDALREEFQRKIVEMRTELLTAGSVQREVTETAEEKNGLNDEVLNKAKEAITKTFGDKIGTLAIRAILERLLEDPVGDEQELENLGTYIADKNANDLWHFSTSIKTARAVLLVAVGKNGGNLMKLTQMATEALQSLPQEVQKRILPLCNRFLAGYDQATAEFTKYKDILSTHMRRNHDKDGNWIDDPLHAAYEEESSDTKTLIRMLAALEERGVPRGGINAAVDLLRKALAP